MESLEVDSPGGGEGAATTLQDEMPPGSMRGAGAGWLLLLQPYRRLDVDYAFLRAVRWRAWSWPGAGRMLLLPYWLRSTHPFAPPGGVRGAGTGRLLLLPYRMRPAPPRAPLREAGGDGWLLLPYWTRPTPP